MLDPALVHRLVNDFAELDPGAVGREVARADAAARFTGLTSDDERLPMVELVARHQLELLAGRREDGARLDPERHPSRRPLVALGPEC